MSKTLLTFLLIFFLVIISTFLPNNNCCNLASAQITQPAVITDLTPVDQTFFSATLSWTSPERDVDKSKVFSYDIRYSKSVISKSNWDSANQALGEPIPIEAGKSQSMTIIDLSPQTTYYFSIKIHDDLGNISELSNVTNITTLNEPTKTIHLTQCGSLSQSDTCYILDNDVSCDGTCFTIKASNIILDLNGHTVTYDDFPSGLPNGDFELGDGTVPSDWNLTGAPTAKRVPTTDKVMVRKWYLKFENPETSQTIVSPWISLPRNHDAIAYFLKGDHDWKYNITYNLIVEYEDNRVVASFTNDSQYLLNFKTLDADGKYRLKLTIVDPKSDPTVEDIHIDIVDLRATNYYGIFRAWQNGGPCIVKNGKIKQGRGGSFRGHTIFNLDSDYMLIKDVNFETWGLEAASFRSQYSDNCNMLNSTVINNNPHVFNRMQLAAAVDFTFCQYCNIANNTIMSDTGWGCIYYGGATNSNIYNNILKTKSTITNHHAINAGNDNINIFNNNIEGDPGQGIIAGQSKDIDISNNIITIKKIAPNLEYGCMSLDAIRINDYHDPNSQQATDMKIHDNNIFIIGDFDEYYSPICENLHVNGILTLASGPNNYVFNNYIKVTVVDDNVCASGISPGSNENNEVIFKNNVIESNCSNIMLTSYSRECHHSTFVSNTFIKDDNLAGLCSDFYRSYPPPKYCTLSTRYTLTSVKNTHFIDTTLGNGASLEELYLSQGFGEYSYFVDWYLYLNVKDNSGNPISGAVVNIKNKNGEEVYNGTTDQDGKIEKITLNQFEHYGSGINETSFYNYQTPHIIDISATGFEPQTLEVDMKGSKNVTITLSGGQAKLLECNMENDEDINSPTTVKEKVDGWETGSAIIESGSGDVTYEPGYSGMAVRLNGTSGNDEQVVFKGSNFDFFDLEGDGGRMDFWLKFNVDPHQAGEYYILRTQPWLDIFNIDLLGQDGNPYLIFEFFGNANNPKTDYNRFLVYTRGWDKWENWQKDEWHLITLTWKRNPEEADDELHLYIDGTQEGCTSCNDAGGILPTPNSEDWDWSYAPEDVQVVWGNYFGLAIDMSVDGLSVLSSLENHVSIDDAMPPGDTIPPSTPVNLNAEIVSNKQINLTWDASIDNTGITGYKIYRDGVQIDTTANLFYSDTGISMDKPSFTYKISAYDKEANESGQSFPVTLLIPSNLIKPRPPQNLRMQLLK